MNRSLTAIEEQLITRILSVFADESISFRSRRVRVIDDEGSVRFEGTTRGASQRALPVEAQFMDTDGIYVHALVFVANNEIDELEIYKDDFSKIGSMPSADDWEVLDLRQHSS